MFDQPLYPAIQNSQTFLCDHIFHVSSSSFSSAGLRWVSHCPQVQVIKHRPKQIQKAYPGLLEPGYSYSLAASATKPFNTDALDKKRHNTFYPFCCRCSLSHTYFLIDEASPQHALQQLFTWRRGRVTARLSLERTTTRGIKERKHQIRGRSVCVLSHFDVAA